MLKKISKILILSLAIGFIVQQLSGFFWINSALSVLVFITIISSLPSVKGPTKILSMCFLIIGIAVMFFQQASFKEWEEAATLNLSLITLFVFAPMFGIPVRSPVYVLALKRFYQLSIKGNKAFYLASQLLTQVLAVFLNVGSISIVYHLASIHRCSRNWRLISNALNRGFAGAIIWSPYFSAMILVTNALNVSWTHLLPYLIGYTFIYILLSFLEEFVPYKKLVYQEEAAASLEETEEGYNPLKEESIKSLVPLLCYLLMAILIIIALEQIDNIGMVVIISLSAIVYPMLWCLFNGSYSFYKKGAYHHIHEHLPSIKREIVLFLTAGFLSGAIRQTNIGEWLPSILNLFPLPISVVFSFITLFFIILTSLIGSHPIVLVTILATTVNPADVGISPEFFALLLIGSWSISNMISPASAVNNLLSKEVHTKVSKLMKINYVFTALLCIVLPLYLFLSGI